MRRACDAANVGNKIYRHVLSETLFDTQYFPGGDTISGIVAMIRISDDDEVAPLFSRRSIFVLTFT